METLSKLIPIDAPLSMKRFFLWQAIIRHGLVTILFMIFFISYFVSCTPVSEQKKQHGMSEDLLSVTFPTEKEGWACGRWGVVLHTVDGGKTWTLQSSGNENTLVSICFVDPQNGWAVGEEGTILHTTDGGKTWEKQKSPVPFYLMKVYFVTPLKGWIVGERTHILSTVDGGKTWNIQFKDEDFILKSISFCDPLHGWAVGEYGFIYHTKNGGANWKKQAGHFDISEETGAVEGGNFLFDITAVDPQTAWAVGIDGYVIRTLDGGKTWKEVKTDAPKTQLFCVASNQGGTVLIGGNGTILISMDDGKTWKNPKFEPPIIYGWLYGLARRGSSEFVTVGWDGSIYLSEGGNPLSSWHRVKM
jgi:photosystem II stability/assembly factor-like uncharacterized protein